MKKLLSIFFAVILSLVVSIVIFPAYPVMAQTNVFHVTPSGNEEGGDWENACSLRYALTNASSGDQIWVAAGTYTPGTARTNSFDLDVDGVALYGGFAGKETSLEERDWENNKTILSGEIGTEGTGDNSYHVVTSSGLDATAVLDGFTITGGNANGTSGGAQDRGGGMYNYQSSPTVTNCIFSGNSAYHGGGMFNQNNSSPTVTSCNFSGNSAIYSGGGMYNDNSSPIVTNCTLDDNSAGAGGGMLNYGSSPTVTDSTFSGNEATSTSYGGGGMSNIASSPTLTSCTFSGNSANYGGGMYNYNYSSANVTNCIFSGNSADAGGGMYNDYSSANVTNCTFYDNSADYGGGMGNHSSSPTVTNCTFYKNSADRWGGGMFNNYSSPTVTNCTFYENSAVGFFNYNGGGMLNNNTSKPTVTNCILWNNNPDQIGNRSSSPTVTYCDVQGGYGGDGNIGAMPEHDPKFANAATGDFHLLSNSPCTDNGTNSAPALPDTDFEGDPRIVDGHPEDEKPATVDMGVDEFVLETVIASVDIKPDTLNLNSKGQGKWITCYIELEESYDVADIEVSTIELNNEVDAELEPTGLGDYDEDNIPDLMVKFDRASVQEILEVGDEVEIVITGEIDGTSFEGTDTIRVIDNSND